MWLLADCFGWCGDLDGVVCLFWLWVVACLCYLWLMIGGFGLWCRLRCWWAAAGWLRCTCSCFVNSVV